MEPAKQLHIKIVEEDYKKLLDKIIEESAEIIQAALKAKKHGIYNYHPDRPDSNNYEELLNEFADLMSAFNMLENERKMNTEKELEGKDDKTRA